MTDEQVKKGLECCADDDRSWCSNEDVKGACPYWERFKEQICPIEHCREAIAKDALALINRLESDLYYAEAKAQGKTAKDILQCLAQFRAVSPTFSKTWYALAEKYGVEVGK